MIIIDPQYGGKDYGPEISDIGVYSKDITLDISIKLRDIINKYNKFKVILPREKDVDLSTEKRVKPANRIKDDIFISIGINVSKYKTKSGLELITAELKFDKKVQDNKSKMSQDMNAIINDLSSDISRRYKKGAQLARSICEKANEYSIIKGVWGTAVFKIRRARRDAIQPSDRQIDCCPIRVPRTFARKYTVSAANIFNSLKSYGPILYVSARYFKSMENGH